MTLTRTLNIRWGIMGVIDCEFAEVENNFSAGRTVKKSDWVCILADGGARHPAGTPGFRRLTATHYGPFQGQQTLQLTDCDTIALFRANKHCSKPADTTRTAPGLPDRL
jgi:hypothetical protein